MYSCTFLCDLDLWLLIHAWTTYTYLPITYVHFSITEYACISIYITNVASYIYATLLSSDLHRFSKVSFSPFTGHILTERKTNVPTSRVFTCNGAEFKWATILSKLQNVCQNVLLCPYICKTSLNEVIHKILTYT